MDSLVAVYISEQDSLEFKDPTTYTYKVLKAYHSHDTAFFRDMQKQSDMKKQYVYPVAKGYCPSIPPLRSLHAEEAYRFIHSESFCLYTEVITIYKTGDTIQLQYVAFVPPSDDGRLHVIRWDDSRTDSVVDNYLIRKIFTKKVTLQEWNAVEEGMDNTDFWGLKTNDQRIVLDGSYWAIQAVLKEPRFIEELQTHAVYRQSPVLKEFRDLGKLFLRLSGEKSVCGSLD